MAKATVEKTIHLTLSVSEANVIRHYLKNTPQNELEKNEVVKERLGICRALAPFTEEQ